MVDFPKRVASGLKDSFSLYLESKLKVWKTVSHSLHLTMPHAHKPTTTCIFKGSCREPDSLCPQPSQSSWQSRPRDHHCLGTVKSMRSKSMLTSIWFRCICFENKLVIGNQWLVIGNRWLVIGASQHPGVSATTQPRPILVPAKLLPKTSEVLILTPLPKKV